MEANSEAYSEPCRIYMTEVIAQNRGYFFQKALFEMFDKILSSPLKPATSVEKATSQIYEVSPLINSENL